MQRIEWLTPGAYAGSWAAYLYNARRLKVIGDNHIEAIAEGTSSTLFCSIMEADDLITCSLPEAPSMLGSYPVTEAPTNIQHQLYDIKQHAKSKELFSKVSQRHQARLTALQGKVPGLWLQVTPSGPNLSMPLLTFQDALRTRLGLGPHIKLAGRVCKCGTFFFDPAEADQFMWFLHLQKCPHLNGPSRCHNACVGIIGECMRQTGHEVTAEPLHTFVEIDTPVDHKDKRADLLVQGLDRGAVLLDVSITNPCASSVFEQASRKRLSAANRRYREKMRKFDDLCRVNGYSFTPLVLETFGGLHSDILTLIAEACQSREEVFDAPSWTSPTMTAYYINCLAVCLQKETARYVRTLAMKARHRVD